MQTTKTDQTVWMHRLIWVFVGTRQRVRFLMLPFISADKTTLTKVLKTANYHNVLKSAKKNFQVDTSWSEIYSSR